KALLHGRPALPPTLNSVIPSGIRKPARGKKKGKKFVESSQQLHQILDLVNDIKEGQIKLKSEQAAYLEALKSARDDERRRQEEEEKGKRLDDRKEKKRRERKRDGDGGGGGRRGGEEEGREGEEGFVRRLIELTVGEAEGEVLYDSDRFGVEIQES